MGATKLANRDCDFCSGGSFGDGLAACQDERCSRNDLILSMIDYYFEGKTNEENDAQIEPQNESKIVEAVEEPKKPTMSTITSIDGIPIEKFHSGEYYLQDNRVVKRQELGVIEQIINDLAK